MGHAGPIWALWVMFWTILEPSGVPKRPQSGPIWLIIMYYTCENYFNATRANFDPARLIWAMQGHFGPFWAVWAMFWTILGPPGVPKRPPRGPIWHIIMCYTRENYFNATWANFDYAGSIWVMQDQFGPFGWCFGPFWGPQGCLKDPRVAQYDI